MIVKVLGSGQDAGIPQAGCACPACRRARRNARHRRRGPSLGIYDRRQNCCWLIDASPDFKEQLAMISAESPKPGRLQIRGIFLTHGHAGHYMGLWQLGKEAMNAKRIPVFGTAPMAAFLKNNAPCSLLVKQNNIKVFTIRPDRRYQIAGLTVTPFLVPHRSELTDTVGYLITNEKTLLYLPDIDFWTENIINRIQRADINLLDGTFYSAEELPRYRQVPHPPIDISTRLIGGRKNLVYFTHLNHTNAVNENSPERMAVRQKGFRIARDGMTFKL